MFVFRKRALMLFALAFGVGVILASAVVSAPMPFFIATIVLGAMALTAMYLKTRYNAWLAVILYLAAVVMAGATYTSTRIEAKPEFESEYNASFSGVVAGRPYIDSDGERFVCDFRDVQINSSPFPARLRLYLRGSNEQLATIGCGMRVEGIGHLINPGEVTNPHEYDFGGYLWQNGEAGFISAYLDNSTISGERHGYADLVYRIRTAIDKHIDRLYGDCGDIVKALLTGDKHNMETELREAFQTAGVAHLLAISGLHITLIAMLILNLLKYPLGYHRAYFISLLVILAYCVVIGFTPSVSRAVIMYAMLMIAPCLGRLSDTATRLACAFVVVLLINPLQITNVGFALSFSAAAGIIWFTPSLVRITKVSLLDSEKRLPRLLRRIAETALTTLAAQIASYPLIAHYFGSFSLISTATNIIIAPYAMICLIASAVGLILPFLSVIPYHMIRLLRAAVGFCGRWEWAAADAFELPVWLWIGFLIVALVQSDLCPIRKSHKPYALISIPLMLIIAYIASIGDIAGIVFLDAGQADSAVIRYGDSAYVVDVGESGDEAIDYINGEGLNAEVLFLSHPHYDHAGGLSEFLEACPVDTVYVPVGWHEMINTDSIVEETNVAIADGVRFVELSPGDVVDINDEMRVTVLSNDTSGDAVNDISLIMLFEYGQCRVLFTGDGRAADVPDIDILKVAHHGDDSVTYQEMIDAASPAISIISVGANNSYGHPSESVVAMLTDSGSRVYRTDRDGAVSVKIRKYGKINVKTYR